MNRKILTLYFSATGTTERIVHALADGLERQCSEGTPVHHLNFTLPQDRRESPSFGRQDLVVVGVPVYAGRVPNVLLKYLKAVSGNGAQAVAVVVYGNRHYDDALIELADILESGGFSVVAAGAFVGEHSFSRTMGKDRPDDRDMALVDDFARRIGEKLAGQDVPSAVAVAGNRPYREYYKPVDKEGRPVNFRRIIPKTNEECLQCKLCASVCPMGSIDEEDVSKITGICIKCCACVKFCPVGAKVFDDINFIRHKEELEAAFTARREPEVFL